MISCLGQVRMFNMHRFLCTGQGKKKGGGGGVTCTGGYKGVQAVQPESVAGRGFEVLTLQAFLKYFIIFQQDVCVSA